MRWIGTIVFLLALPAVLYAAALVNINTADQALLDTLPGIGPAKAQAIIDYRTRNGPFTTIEDIQNVSGIGPTTFANMKDMITIDASAETKPAALLSSSNQVQTSLEPITSENIQAHEETAVAPAAATELAPAGAPLPPPESRGAGIFTSPWTLGLLGVVIVAAAAFIFL